MPDSLKPTYEIYKEAFLDILVQAGMIAPPSTKSTTSSESVNPGEPFTSIRSQMVSEYSNFELPGLTRARSSHTDVVNKIDSVRKTIETTQKSLDKDWGRDWEWKKLEGTCVEKDLGS